MVKLTTPQLRTAKISAANRLGFQPVGNHPILGLVGRANLPKIELNPKLGSAEILAELLKIGESTAIYLKPSRAGEDTR